MDRMKTYRYITALMVLLARGSCQKYLDIVPDNVATLKHAFSNEFNTERYLLTCYSYMPNAGGVNQNPALNAGDEIWYPEQLRNDNGPTVAQGFTRGGGYNSNYLTARSEEHTSELQSLMRISYAVFCLKKTNKI